MSRVTAKGYFDLLTAEQRSQMLDHISQQRWEDAKNGTAALSNMGLPSEIKGDEPEFVKGYFDYYKTSRGFHERSINSNSSWTITSPVSLMNMPILTYINEISPRPILLIAGENAHSLYFSKDVFAAAAEPKELLIIPGAVHTDLYDGGNNNYIPLMDIPIKFTPLSPEQTAPLELLTKKAYKL